jgi:hypothetical protein
MKKISLWYILILSLTISFFSACGAGGGRSSVTVAQPTTAVLTFSTAVTGTIPSSTIITGYDVTITLPAGVTVKASPDLVNPSKLVTDSGVVTATDSAPESKVMTLGIYTAATETTMGKVQIFVFRANSNGDGISVGDFSQITCNIAAGYYPAASDFPMPTFQATGLVTPTNFTVDLTGQLALTVTAVIN